MYLYCSQTFTFNLNHLFQKRKKEEEENQKRRIKRIACKDTDNALALAHSLTRCLATSNSKLAVAG